MTIKNIKIKIKDNPTVSEFDPKDLGLPSDAELQRIYSNTVDNFSIPEQDPTNWLTFEPGNGETFSPRWVYRNTGFGGGSGLYDDNSLIFKYAGESLNIYQTHGVNFEFHADGGPRNLGYTNIADDTWIRLNHQLGFQKSAGDPSGGAVIRSNNEVWKEGSIELTIKPTKLNCTLLSGTVMPDTKDNTITFTPNADGNQLAVGVVKTGVDVAVDNINDYDIQLELDRNYAVSEDKAYPNKIQVVYDPLFTTAIPYLFEDVNSGLSLTSLEHTVRTFKVDIVDGFLRVSYEIYYGDNKKYLEFYGKTNIVDGDWHHIVINRPSPFTIKDGDNLYGGDGCIEVWVDGQLDARSYEITTNDPLPAPNVLFNEFTNPGILNYPQFSGLESEFLVEKDSWMIEEIAKTNYVGGIRDFIFRQSIALSPHFIKLNHVYALLNGDGYRVCKATKLKATATIVEPSVSVNKKTILKLYWDSLLDDKTKCLNGLEFDETYNVHSFSVTKKNAISSTQTFNLDLNDSTKTRMFLENVKTAIGKHIFVPKPGIVINAKRSEYSSGLGALPHKDFIDYTHEPNVLKQYFGKNNAWYLSNLQYGGVYLNPGDRVLLFNQPKFSDNGIWIFNGPNDKMTRPTDVKLSDYKNALVYVTDGKYAGKTYIQTNNVTNLKRSAQKWIEVDESISLSASDVYPVHTTPWLDNNGNERFIDVIADIDFDYDIIAFMNYPTENKDIVNSFKLASETKIKEEYDKFVNNLKSAVNSGKSLYVSSPRLAIDLGIVDEYVEVDQMLNPIGDAQSASISPFESGEPAAYYFDTHRNSKYHVSAEVPGLTNRETYIMSDFVTYSPDRTNSDYHIKYNYRQFGLQEGDEFLIPGLTTLPETLNGQLPGYLYNQRGTSPLAAFPQNSVNLGTIVTQFSNTIYDGSTIINNPYDDYATTIAVEYGNGKMFVNCVENGYAFSRSDYNTGIVQNVTAGQNAETVQTAAWQYSSKRLNKQNLYDFSEISNLVGQTTPTAGGGGAIVQSQSHCSNGIIRKNTNKDDLQYQSDLYPDVTEEVFTTTTIPVLSMTWLGLKWLAE